MVLVGPLQHPPDTSTERHRPWRLIPQSKALLRHTHHYLACLPDTTPIAGSDTPRDLLRQPHLLFLFLNNFLSFYFFYLAWLPKIPKCK
jgi:hypothetical protein